MQALCVKASDEGLYQALHSLMKDSGWLYRLQAARSDGQAVAGNIFKALEIVLAWQQQACSIPHLARRFSDFLATSKEKPGVLSTSRSNFVRIMTIHSSKGLEFDHVAVAEPHEGLPKSTKLPMETVASESSSPLNRSCLKIRRICLELRPRILIRRRKPMNCSKSI